MDLEVVGTPKKKKLLQNHLFWESKNVNEMNIFWFSPPNYVAQTFSQSYQRSSDIDIFWKF